MILETVIISVIKDAMRNSWEMAIVIIVVMLRNVSLIIGTVLMDVLQDVNGLSLGIAYVIKSVKMKAATGTTEIAKRNVQKDA
jgi:hypothetical protein